MPEENSKLVNLALQGGGAHGAFAWGVLDKLVEDGRVGVDGLSATSAGSMNAVVYAYGKMTGGPDGAREALHNFWRAISDAGQLYSPMRRLPWDWPWFNGESASHSLTFLMFEVTTRIWSPYQYNPFNFNPLRSILQKSVDFERLTQCQCTNLFISATNVRSGKVKVFRNHEMSLDVVLASACLPYLFQAVEIGGEPYWDGGYMGNPALFPLFYHTEPRDIVILHINPMTVDAVPTSAADILDRVNEITFNSSLLKELRAIAFATKLIEEDWLKDEHKSKLRHMLIHSILADCLADLSVASKFDCSWNFLTTLRDRGREAAAAWLDENYRHLGKRSTVDLRRQFLDAGSEHIG